ncbi:sodium:calcium antiporter [Lysobacter sp. N42]|uniref:sodium:calcium antiporter n=1 Tax=Lysobacter sp. N42 TaxID=2545719 RepID=UPI00104695DE|nr:sodium:calcium antiporter [Lysobacter sp. N42]TCZ84001.1 sodium:calcium antiporter [Lysobacter sp. N42]
MASALGWFLLGLLLLALGGDSIVKGASGLAHRLRWSPFVVGLVLIALATSIPELAVNYRAVFAGQSDLALGNAVGSNIANVGLTLAAAAMVAPLLLRWRVLAPLLLMLVAATVAVILLALDGRLSALEGGLLAAAFVAVLLLALRRAGSDDAGVRAEIEGFTRTTDGLGRNLLRLAVAVALIGAGAWLVVRDAPRLGEALGLTPLMTGLLPVAIGTALPELAGAIAAARRGQGDLVAGHVLGSSLVNLLLVLGGMALIGGGLAVPASFVRYELPAALVLALMLLPILRGDMRVSRGEGAVLLAAFSAWIVFELSLLAG